MKAHVHRYSFFCKNITFQINAVPSDAPFWTFKNLITNVSFSIVSSYVTIRGTQVH